MKQFSYLFFCVLALGACTGAFKKGDKGLEYKIISSGNGKTLSYGNYVQMHVKQVYQGAKDTILQDTRDFMPSIQMFDSASIPLAYFKILKQARKGDSIIVRMLTDTLFKEAKEPMPAFMKKGKYFYVYFKILNILETPQQADSAYKAEKTIAKPKMYKKQMETIEKEVVKNKPEIDAQGKTISDYLSKNNLKAEKTNWGTYISIQSEGTGEKINENSIATVNYTGRTLDSGIVFDSNVDPKFQHVEPYQVTIANIGQPGSAILGWNDALMHLKKGAKATIYVPSFLAYGKEGNGGQIKGDAILVFDIDILDVMTEEQVIARQEQMRQQMIDAERKRVDSIEKATKK